MNRFTILRHLRSIHRTASRVDCTASSRPYKRLSISVSTGLIIAAAASFLALSFRLADTSPHLQYQHATTVAAIALNNYGTHVASVDVDGDVILFETSTERIQLELQLPNFSGRCVALSPDARILGVGGSGYDQSGLVWIVAPFASDHNARKLPSLSLPPLTSVTEIVIADNNRFLFVGTASYNNNPPAVHLCDLSSDVLIHSFESGNNCISAIALSEQTDLLAYADVDMSDPRRPGSVTVRRISTGALLHQSNDSAGTLSIAFSESGELIACGRADGRISLWIARSGQPFSTLETGCESISVLRFLSSGTIVAGCLDTPVLSEAQLQFWNIDGSGLEGSVAVSGFGVDEIQLANDGALIATRKLMQESVRVLSTDRLVQRSKD